MIQIHLKRGWREDTEIWANVDLTLRWKESKVRCRLFDCPGHRFLKETSTSSSACAFCWKQRRLLKLWFSAAPRSTCFASTSVFQVAAAACLVWSAGAKPHNTSLAPLEQSRIQSTLPWSQACLLCRLLLATLQRALWSSLGIAKPWWMNDRSSRSKSRNSKKVKDLHLLQEIHPWNRISCPRSMRIAWPRRPAKWVLWPMYGAGRSAFEAAWCSKAQQMLAQ